MPILYDMHMHSSFSTDSDAPMQTMAQTAHHLGLSGICLTDHMDLDYPRQYHPSDPNAFAADPEQVYQEVLRLRADYEERNLPLWIGFGLEFGMQAHLSDRFHEIAERYPLDFIIASQHLLDAQDPYYPDAWENQKPEEMIDRYYRELLSNLKKMREWDTLAHLDYIIRYIPGQGDSVYDSMARHSEIIDEILRYVISCGKCLEVNTAGYKYGFLQPHPALSILRRYYALGGRLLTIGADAHRPEHVAFAFDRTEAALRSVGFTGYCIFEGRRMREIPF